MDTKLKKGKVVVSFTVFFLSVSLLAGNAAMLAGQAFRAESWNEDGFWGLMEQDYENTAGFRHYMEERLGDFLAMAARGKASGHAGMDGYYEQIRRNKNLLYQIRRDGAELYTNMDESDKDRVKNPIEGYNFQMFFNGKNVSIEKDGKKLNIYDDRYYKDDSQWYVPGYENFMAEDGLETTEILMLAAVEPVSHTYVSNHNGNYAMGENQLYHLYQNVSANYDRMRLGLFGLAAGALLFALGIALRREKRAADVKLAQITGRIWFEPKLLLGLLLLTGVWRTMDYTTEYTEDLVSAYDEASFYSAPETLEMAVPASQETAEETFVETLEMTFEASQGTADELWMGWEDSQADLRRIGRNLTEHPVFMLICLWSGYLFFNDLCKNRRHICDGFISRLIRQARINGLKQTFAVRQMQRLRTAVAAGMAAGASGVFVLAFLRAGWMSQTEATGTQCLILAALVAISYHCLSEEKRQAKELDLLAEHIHAVQNGDYTEKESFAEDSFLKPLSDSLSQIRQGIQTAVNEQLKSERMKVELVANVSHDLKTPLTSIISYISFLKQEEELPEHVRDYIRILDEKATRLNSIVRDVFAVSKAASGQLPVELKKLDFGKLLRQTLADMEEEIQKSAVLMKTDIPQEAVMITADGTRLYRVFQNLIQNALRYSLEGSRVFVELKREGEYAVAGIKNISQQELRAGADFTERFVRGDASRTDGGAGLGLSIAKSFTEACGGIFTLETNADLFVVHIAFAVKDDDGEPAADADA